MPDDIFREEALVEEFDLAAAHSMEELPAILVKTFSLSVTKKSPRQSSDSHPI